VVPLNLTSPWSIEDAGPVTSPPGVTQASREPVPSAFGIAFAAGVAVPTSSDPPS